MFLMLYLKVKVINLPSVKENIYDLIMEKEQIMEDALKSIKQINDEIIMLQQSLEK